MRRSADFVFGINQFVNSICQFAARDGSQTAENVNGLFARRVRRFNSCRISNSDNQRGPAHLTFFLRAWDDVVELVALRRVAPRAAAQRSLWVGRFPSAERGQDCRSATTTTGNKARCAVGTFSEELSCETFHDTAFSPGFRKKPA
jgi:hypothetical protein